MGELVDSRLLGCLVDYWWADKIVIPSFTRGKKGDGAREYLEERGTDWRRRWARARE
jgi:hypothetical protein